MDALTLWVTLALLVVSVMLFYMTRRAHRAERLTKMQEKDIHWLLDNLFLHKDAPWDDIKAWGLLTIAHRYGYDA